MRVKRYHHWIRGKGGGCREQEGKLTLELLPAQPQNDSGANPQIVLAVVETVGDFGHEVLGLYGANGDVLGHFEINAAARRHRKIIFGP
jgi:hypothetical protein